MGDTGNSIKYRCHTITAGQSDTFTLDGEHWSGEALDIDAALEEYRSLFTNNLLDVAKEIHGDASPVVAEITGRLFVFDGIRNAVRDRLNSEHFRDVLRKCPAAHEVPFGELDTPEHTVFYVQADGYFIALNMIG